MHNTSEYFLWDNCKFANEKAKRNCARLAFYRDWGLLDTYTIESSCYCWKVKGTGEEEGEEPQVEQLNPPDFLKFGKQLFEGLCRHLSVAVNDFDLAQMHIGFDIELDYCLGKEDGIQKGPNVPKPVKKKKTVAPTPTKRPDSTQSPNKLRESSESSLNTTNQSGFRKTNNTSSKNTDADSKLGSSQRNRTLSQNRDKDPKKRDTTDGFVAGKVIQRNRDREIYSKHQAERSKQTAQSKVASEGDSAPEQSIRQRALRFKDESMGSDPVTKDLIN